MLSELEVELLYADSELVAIGVSIAEVDLLEEFRLDDPLLGSEAETEVGIDRKEVEVPELEENSAGAEEIVKELVVEVE